MSDSPNKQSAALLNNQWLLIFICWLIATIATLGSLFFSEVMGLKPCVLCWYQRIFMYPLVIVFLSAMWPTDRTVFRYAFPLAIIGWCFAVYHYLVYSGYIPESLQPCSEDVSCAKIDLELLGFITIPMLSILSYTAIILLLIIYRKKTLS
ncbi:MAG: disulfide bond formation protein B [Gammaproteobacteria bacterium]|nr:disulfide bond formation protein B [Gammaproteobacteria bacterium]